MRCRYTVEPGPTSLDLAGRRLAFGWDTADSNGPVSSVYLDTIGTLPTAAEVASLVRLIRGRVREKFGVELHPEPVFVGVSLNDER